MSGTRMRVVVVGGGFGGLQTVRCLARAPVAVTLIDRRNFTLFQPLLYQVATGALSPANIAINLRSVLKRQANASVLLGTVSGFDLAARRVRLEDGDDVPYDALVVAAGARHHYFGHPGWERHAPGLKSLEDAEDIRRRIFLALEEAERAADPERRARLLTFVIVGGGPTSVELAGAVAEITRYTTRREFRTIDPGAARIVLVEADPRVLGGFAPDSSAAAERSLRGLGVEVMLGRRVVEVDAQGVAISPAGIDPRTGSPPPAQRIGAGTILWGAGVSASPLGAILARAAGQSAARGGRVPVDRRCALPGRDDVFVIGDLAAAEQDGQPLPGVALVAIQQGTHVAKAIGARARGRAEPGPFRYRDRGRMATIGKRHAVAEVGGWHLTGRLAWLAWLVLHVMKLIRVENRLLVLVQWAWSYATWNRSARLITGRDPDRIVSEVPGNPL